MYANLILRIHSFLPKNVWSFILVIGKGKGKTDASASEDVSDFGKAVAALKSDSKDDKKKKRQPKVTLHYMFTLVSSHLMLCVREGFHMYNRPGLYLRRVIHPQGYLLPPLARVHSLLWALVTL